MNAKEDLLGGMSLNRHVIVVGGAIKVPHGMPAGLFSIKSAKIA
jgi:hypothetical protein